MSISIKSAPVNIGTVSLCDSLNRSFWQAEILDRGRALKAAANEPEVIEALQIVANRWARESKGLKPLPGTRAQEIRKVV